MPNTIDIPIPVEDCFPEESRPKWSWSVTPEWFIINYEGDESDMAASIPINRLKEALEKLDK